MVFGGKDCPQLRFLARYNRRSEDIIFRQGLVVPLFQGLVYHKIDEYSVTSQIEKLSYYAHLTIVLLVLSC